MTQTAGTLEYTDWITAKGLDSPKKCTGYDINQSDSEVILMLEFGGILSTPSLPLLWGQLWHGEIAPNRVWSMGQIELNCDCMLNWIVWNRTVFTFNCV